MQLTSLTIYEASRLIKSGGLSPVELTQSHLERIQKLDPRLNCFITRTPEIALEMARQAEREIQTGGWKGSLHGIPVALKDLFETRGIRTTAGSKFFADYLPLEDAHVVRRLYQAGAVLLGKLNLHEIALGVTNVNPHYGACRNPWDLERSTGGSSGGSAAALAAGICMGSLGTDTGGSIRIPASLCSVVGLKPTTGRVSLRGVIPLSWNLDHVGPMARCVWDIALLLQAIAGYDVQDAYSAPVPVADYLTDLEAGVRGWRVALVMDEYVLSETDAEIQSGVWAAADVFRELGAQVKHIELPQALEAARANGLMTTSDAAAFHRQRLNEAPQDFGEDVLLRLQSGAAFTSTEYSLARHLQSLLRRQYEELFNDFDVLLTPTTPLTAPVIRLGSDAIERARQLTRFTSPFNLTGLPALSVPCGFTSAGLPYGLQIVARSWGEAIVLRAGYAYEQATEWHQRKPELD